MKNKLDPRYSVSPRLGPESSTSDANHAQRYELVALAGVLFVAVVLRLPGINESLWYDELWATNVMLAPDRILRTLAHDSHPPAHTLFMFAWGAIFGDSELSVRIPSLVFGIAGIALSWQLTRSLVGGRAALLSALLLAMSPVHIWYSQEARSYTMVAFLVLLAVYAFQRAVGDAHERWWLVTCVTSMLVATLAHYYSIAFVGGLAVLSMRRPAAQRRSLWLGFCLIGAAVLAVFATRSALGAPIRTGNWYLRAFTPSEAWYLILHWLPTGGSLWPRAYEATSELFLRIAIEVAILALVVLGVVAVFRASGWLRGAGALLLATLLPTLLMLLPVLGFHQTYVERSAFTVVYFFWGAIAAGAMHLRRIARWTVVGSLVSFSAIALVSYYARPTDWTVYKPNANWRGAASYLDGVGGSGDTVLTVTPAKELLYYRPGTQETREPVLLDGRSLYDFRAADPPDLRRALAELDLRSFHVVENDTLGGPVEELLAAVEARGYRLRHIERFKLLTLYEYVR